MPAPFVEPSARMRWERVRVKMKARDQTDGKKSPGRKGGAAGPGKKWGHTCNSVKNGRYIYVFGGYGKNDCQTNDVHVFDTGTQHFSPQLSAKSFPCWNVSPLLVCSAGALISPAWSLNHYFFFIGIVCTAKETWTKPMVKGNPPSPRDSHTCTTVNTSLYIFGGTDGTNPLKDLHVLDTGDFLLSWLKLFL